MQGSKLYVGNLNYNASEEDLKELFAKYGSVSSATIIRDSYSGQSKGFGFVEMSSSEEAEKALEQNGGDFMERNITVSEARPQAPRTSGGGGGRGGFGGGGGNRRGGSGGGGGRSGNRRGGGGFRH